MQSCGPLIAAAVIILLLALNWVAAVARFQVNTVYWDQWDFSEPLFNERSLLDVFSKQHGPHRQGLAFVFTSWVLEASDWDGRVESLWIASLLVVAAVLVVIWKHRATGRFGWTDLWLPLAALAMRQYETVLVAPNASHSIFPLVLLLLAAIILTDPPNGRRWLMLGVIGGLALFTGFGIFVWVGLVWIAGLRLLRAIVARDRRAVGPPLLAVLLCGAALAWFARGYVFNPASPGATFPHWPLGDYPKFVMLMLASRMDLAPGVIAYIGGAIVLLAGSVIWIHASARTWREETPATGHLTAAFLLTAGLGFAWFTASGRVHLGVEAGMAPRYTSLTLAVWLGLLAWAAVGRSRGLRVAAGVLGWAMVVAPWADLRGREWRDWPGTLGMSRESRDALTRTQGTKAQWLMAWQETGGDHAETERRAPGLIHPDPVAGELGRKIAYLQRRGLSFAAPDAEPWSWLPWWNPTGVTWLKGMGGEHAQWMAEEARLLIEGRETGYLNLRLRWVAPALGPDHPVDIELAGRTARVAYADLLAGLSVPAPQSRSLLVLRSPDGTVPLDPPRDLRQGSFLVEDPTLSAEPAFAVRGWIADTEGLWPESGLALHDGFHRWEQNGAWIWTDGHARLSAHSLGGAWLNVEIASRYTAVNTGPLIIVVDGKRQEQAWSADGVRCSIRLPAGRARQVELVNPAGDQSPFAAGESEDRRRLALRLHRLSVDEAAAFAELGAEAR